MNEVILHKIEKEKVAVGALVMLKSKEGHEPTVVFAHFVGTEYAFSTNIFTSSSLIVTQYEIDYQGRPDFPEDVFDLYVLDMEPDAFKGLVREEVRKVTNQDFPLMVKALFESMYPITLDF